MVPFFSIITSAYNAQKFILTALNSVKAQEENGYEYIIIDNGSNDETFNIINKFIENNPQMNIKLVHFDVNQGISGGRNAGINRAIGEYICFLDADDYWYANKLAVVKNIITSNREYDVFCHWENHIEDGSTRLGEYREIDNEDAYKDLLFNGNCLSTSAMTIRTSLLKDINGFDTRYVTGEEDFDCWLRLARKGAKFYSIKEPLGVWLIRHDSISSKYIKHTDAVINMLQWHFDYLAEHTEDKPMVEKARRKNKARNLCGCGRTLSLSGDRKAGNEMYRKAIKADSMYLKSYAGIFLNFFHK